LTLEGLKIQFLLENAAQRP